MTATRHPRLWGLIALISIFLVAPTSAEIIEEIVAWVEGDMISLSEFRAEEQLLVQQLYQQFTGEELDARLAEARSSLLMNMIDRKILLNRAGRMFDLERVGENYLKQFKEQNDIQSDEELERVVGMTADEVRERMVARYAPEQVIQLEVNNRIAIGDAEVEAYYEANPDEFDVPGEVLLREIVLLADDSNREERRAQAATLRQSALDGADFGELAKESSEAGTAAGGGLLGPLQQGELSETLEAVAFTAEVGSVSDVLEMPYGFHLLKVEERKEAGRRTLDEVRDGVRGKLEQQRYLEELQGFLGKIRTEADWWVNKKYEHRLSGTDSG